MTTCTDEHRAKPHVYTGALPFYTQLKQMSAMRTHVVQAGAHFWLLLPVRSSRVRHDGSLSMCAHVDSYPCI